MSSVKIRWRWIGSVTVGALLLLAGACAEASFLDEWLNLATGEDQKGWAGVFCSHRDQEGRDSIGEIADQCIANLGCVDSVLLPDGTAAAINGQLAGAGRKLFYYYGHSRIIDGFFAGLYLASGPDYTSVNASGHVDMCVVWGCRTARTGWDDAPEAERMRAKLGSQVWVGTTFMIWDVLHKPRPVARQFFTELDHNRTVAYAIQQTLEITPSWRDQAGGGLCMIGNGLYRLDTTR